MSEQGERSAVRTRAVRAYVAANVATGVLVLLSSAVAAWHAPHPLGWLTLGAVAIVAGSFRLTFASGSANIAIDDTFFITTAMMFGPAPATLAIAASGF